jgi:hypothetical protein
VLKFSKADAIRTLIERKIDEFFAIKIDAVLGPMAALHARKRVMVQAGLIDDDGISERAAEQDIVLLAIDKERRALKAQIRAASTSDEIKIIAEAFGIK